MHKFSLENLKHWFIEEKRDFPWRKNKAPYAVWVSEVMLQQTRAAVVVPYFERWMQRFPNISILARASVEEVIKLWEGLGYYSRARSLHVGAKYLVKHHGGNLPSDAKLLEKVKGLGPYTIGAIRSFAFHEKAAAIDGNVIRVISRLFCIEEEVESSLTQKEIRKNVEQLLPDTEPWVIMEALIELGASVCLRKPTCEKCPMQEDCLGYRLGKTEELPRRKKRVEMIDLQRSVSVIYHQRDFLVQKQKGKKVMADLYEFPYFETQSSIGVEESEQIESFYPAKLTFSKKLKEVKHSFTRYKAHLFPTLWKAMEKKEVAGFEWIFGPSLILLPFSSGHRRILMQILEEHANLTH